MGVGLDADDCLGFVLDADGLAHFQHKEQLAKLDLNHQKFCGL